MRLSVRCSQSISPKGNIDTRAQHLWDLLAPPDHLAQHPKANQNTLETYVYLKLTGSGSMPRADRNAPVDVNETARVKTRADHASQQYPQRPGRVRAKGEGKGQICWQLSPSLAPLRSCAPSPVSLVIPAPVYPSSLCSIRWKDGMEEGRWEERWWGGGGGGGGGRRQKRKVLTARMDGGKT